MTSPADDDPSNKKQAEITSVPQNSSEPPIPAESSLPVPTGEHVPLTTRVVFMFSSMSVRYKIASALIVILALAIASLGAVTFSMHKRVLENEMKKRAGILVQQLANVAKEGLLTKEELSSFAFIEEIQKDPSVEYAMILDAKGKVFAHNEVQMKGTVLSDELTQKAMSTDALLFQLSRFKGETVLDTSIPVLFKLKNIRIGTARIGLSEKELHRAIRKQKFVFASISVGFVVIGLLISFALARILTQPIYNLVMAMQVVSQGDLSRQAKVFYRDEIGKLTEAFNQMILNLREKLHMEKYLSFSTLSSIRKHRDVTRLKLGGEEKFVTVLFSDVRGFTSMSEKMPPEEVVQLLNVYLNFQSKIINSSGGVVDKFVGDEVMAIFEDKGQENRAVRASVEIQRYCQSLNWARSRLGQKHMQLGIGLNSGDVVMGNMGSEEQMNYTAIGDTINLGARLCGVAHPGQVVISKRTADALGKDAKLKKLEPVSVKGKEKPIEIFEVQDVRGASRRFMRRISSIPVTYRLAGLDGEPNQAQVVNLSAMGCLMEVSLPLSVGSQLELEMLLDLKNENFKTSGVVRHIVKKDQGYIVGTFFPDISDDKKAQLIEWVHRVESQILPS